MSRNLFVNIDDTKESKKVIKIKKIKKENIRINILNSPLSNMQNLSPLVMKLQGSPPKDKDWKK